jgi:hypothetical protein
MLDLDPAVDLDEVEVAVAIDEELERPDVLVAGGDDGLDGALVELGAGGVGQRWRGALLEDLLVASLDGAVAVTEVDAMAVAIDRDLDFDVAVLVEPLLEVQRIVAEGGLRLGPADPDRALELAGRPGHAHALAAASGRWLDEDRVADPVGLAQSMEVVTEHPVRAGDRRQAVAAEQLAGARLAGESLEDRRRRPDEHDVVRGDDLGEALVLAQEAVTRMDGVAAGDERRRDDGRGRQVRALRIGGPDADGLVGELHGERRAIGLAVRDDRLDAELVAGAQDAQGDLAPVRDKDLPEHRRALSRPCRSSTRRPARIR